MQPVLFELFGIPINSYGVSKALAAIVAAYLLSREFARLGWNRDKAWDIVFLATVVGFIGGKAYFLAENAGDLQLHHLGGSGFTWYGGLIAGAATFVWLARRHRLPLRTLAGISAAPLAVAYGIGRIGCFLAGDGTYGRPTDLPWGMAFPDGFVPTTVAVHPTGLYEAAAAFVLAAVLWALRTRTPPLRLFGAYASASGVTRILVETVRTNDPVVLGLTQPQIWSMALVVVGFVLLLVRERETPPTEAVGAEAVGAGVPSIALAADERTRS